VYVAKEDHDHFLDTIEEDTVETSEYVEVLLEEVILIGGDLIQAFF
jgi:hypothetical protein